LLTYWALHSALDASEACLAARRSWRPALVV
jgi:hypothetical protein